MVATVVGIVSATIVAGGAIGVIVPALESAFAASVAASSFAARTESTATAVAMTVTAFAALEPAFTALKPAFAALETTSVGLLVVVVRNGFFGSDRRAFVLYPVERFEGLARLLVVRHLDKAIAF